MNYKTLAFWGMICFIFILGGYVMYYLHTEGGLCLTNPYNYTIALLERANGADVSCACSNGRATAILTHNGFEPFGNSQLDFSFIETNK